MAFTAALIFFFPFWHFWHRFRFSHRPSQAGMSHPAIFWPLLSVWHVSTFWYDFYDVHLIRFAEGSERAGERLEGETHVWDDFPSL